MVYDDWTATDKERFFKTFYPLILIVFEFFCQVAFDVVVRVLKILTQGGLRAHQCWVTSFYVASNNDTNVWEIYLDGDRERYVSDIKLKYCYSVDLGFVQLVK